MQHGTELIMAGETLDRLASQYTGMITAAAALKGIGSIENHLEELIAKRDAQMKTIDALENDIADANDALDAVRSKIENEKSQAEMFAAAQKDIAQAEANEIITRANAAAAAVTEQTNTVIEGKYADVAAEEAKLAELVAFAHEAVEKVKLEHKAAEDARDAAQAQYDKIQEAVKAITGA